MKKELECFCRNVTNIDNDTFVGIKSESDNDGNLRFFITFPIGYNFSENEFILRKEILQLINVLKEYKDNESSIFKPSNTASNENFAFPLHAYMEVLMDYLTNGPFKVKEERYVTGTFGIVNWNQTIKKEEPFATAKGVIYPLFRIKQKKLSEIDLITEISNFCAYESHIMLGWLFNLPLIQKPIRTRNNDVYLEYLRNKLFITNKDREKQLLLSMIEIIENSTTFQNNGTFFFGTNRFEYIWERLVQATFGNISKELFFPKTKWILDGRIKSNNPLEPDTIMMHQNNLFVLDAKYYKFGVTQNPKDLPNSSSINKQITYGEYIYLNKIQKFPYLNINKIYNAFIMPFNAQENIFKQNKKYLYFGEARAEWKNSNISFEKVHGILVDTKTLINDRYTSNNNNSIKELARIIIESSEKERI